MKTKTHLLRLLTLVCFITITSCYKKPTSDFSWSPVNPKAGETVSFTNNSTDAKKYEWNLGNMSISKEKEPSTIYLEGQFIVDLTVYNGTKKDTKTQTITVTP
jgi:PKD repeat protein